MTRVVHLTVLRQLPRFGVPPREPVNTNAVGSSGGVLRQMHPELVDQHGRNRDRPDSGSRLRRSDHQTAAAVSYTDAGGPIELDYGSDGIERGRERDGQTAVVLHERANELLFRLHRGAQALRHVLDPVVTIGVPPVVPTVERSPPPPADLEHRRQTAWFGQWASLAPQLPERSDRRCARRVVHEWSITRPGEASAPDRVR